MPVRFAEWSEGFERGLRTTIDRALAEAAGGWFGERHRHDYLGPTPTSQRSMRDTFHLFTYGTLKDGAPGILDGCERVDTGEVRGTLYDLGDYPALLLSGEDRVPGAIWRCPADRLPILDRYEETDDGLFRRAGVEVGEYACWVYLAGPKLGHRLVPEARVHTSPEAS